MHSLTMYSLFILLIDRYGVFKSSFLPTLATKSFDVGPFYQQTKGVSFWVHMYGPDCGTLFVRMITLNYNLIEGHKTLFELNGNTNKNYWRKVTMATDLSNPQNSFYVSIK